MAEKRELLSKGKTKKVEKVENRGTFRIVGQVFEHAESKTALGYGIIDVKNCELRLFTKKQTVELLKRYKFENAVLDDNGKVVNTECSMDRLIKFNTNKGIIGNAGITILGQIILNGKEYGYRVLNQLGKVSDVTEETLLLLSKNGEALPILNAKVIKEGVAKPYISAIRGDFKRIEISEFEEMQNTVDAKNVKLAHAKYLERVKKQFAGKLRFNGFVRLTNSESCKKNAKILLTEYILPKYPFLNKNCGLSVTELLTLAYLIELEDGTFDNYNVGRFMVHSKKVGNPNVLKHRFTNDAINVALANGYDKIAFTMKTVNDIIDGKLRSLKHLKNNYVSDNANLCAYLGLFHNKKARREEEITTYNPMNLDYESVQGIEVFGYTVNRAKVGQEFKSPLFKKPKKLRWVLEDINTLPCNEDYIVDRINCFGDVELMRKVIKYKNLSDTSRFDRPEYKIKSEAYLFVLACNNLELAKYVNEMCGGYSSLPLEEINREKFSLDKDDELFYLSGGKFNRSINLQTGESWSTPKDGKGALSNFTGGYFAALSLYMTIGGSAERHLVD